MATAIKGVLEAESFAVDVSHDGQEGLNAALYEVYDLIVLDRMLPDGLDGADICKELRKAGREVPGVRGSIT